VSLFLSEISTNTSQDSKIKALGLSFFFQNILESQSQYY
jgi:hypothetical protein